MNTVRSLMARLLSRPARRPAARPDVRARLGFTQLEDRLTPYTSADVFSQFNAGLDGWAGQAEAVATRALEADVPVVRQTLAAPLGVADKLKQAVQAKIADPKAAVAAVRDALVKQGFSVAVIGATPDASGRVLEVSRRIVAPAAAVSFDVGGTTGFTYFDDKVTGTLSGRLTGAAPAAVLAITMGVDVRGGKLGFYVTDATTFEQRSLTVTGSVGGNLGLRDLAAVGVKGTAELKADATIRLKDIDADGRIRLEDFAGRLAEVVRGEVKGTVKLQSVELTAKLRQLPEIKWGGNFALTFGPGGVQPGSVSLRAPDAAATAHGLARALLDSLAQTDFLASIRDKLDKKLPLINMSINDFDGLNKALGWLAGLVNVPNGDLVPEKIVGACPSWGSR